MDEQLSDTLLSILAIRGGELVQSMFGDGIAASSSERSLSSSLASSENGMESDFSATA